MKGKKSFPGELIGEEIVVSDAANKSLNGVRGIIIDETKETLVLMNDKNEKRRKVILKSAIRKITLKSSGKEVSGEGIRKRPEERIKG
jgi:RNase P/RNase MRP subunit p29